MGRVKLVHVPPVELVVPVCMNMREKDREEIFATRWEDADANGFDRLAADVMASGNFRWAATIEDRPVALIGAVPKWPGAWNVWAFGTWEWADAAITLTRHVRKYMIPRLFAAGARRAECLAMEANTSSCRWLEFLGAERETTLDNYGKGGQTFVHYCWSRERTKRLLT